MSARDGEPSIAELLPLMRAVGYCTDWVPLDRRLLPAEACALAGSSFRDLGRRIKRGWRFVGDHAGGGDTAPLLLRLDEVAALAGLALGLAHHAHGVVTGGVAVDSPCAAARVAALESELREADEQLDTMHDGIEASLAALRSGARPTFEDTLAQLRDIAMDNDDAPLALAALYLGDGAEDLDEFSVRVEVGIKILAKHATDGSSRLGGASPAATVHVARTTAALLRLAASLADHLAARAAAPAVNPETKGDRP